MNEQNPNPVVVAQGTTRSMKRSPSPQARPPGPGAASTLVMHLLTQWPELPLVAETDLGLPARLRALAQGWTRS
ncbi:hypothetical protein [Nocardioides sp.]|uniref:hypothetical protein n=1 Tax=Nocardioides sp. TaxID=35761 RepID=UPI002D803C60|nr:hypothetical protein [Nocardioides sp.]HET8960849.1 hypothetical protein [Nocardioides sp.]